MGNNFHKGKEVLGSLPEGMNKPLCYLTTDKHASVIKPCVEFSNSWGKKECMPHINLDEHPLFQNGYKLELCFKYNVRTTTINQKGEFMAIFVLDEKEYYGRFNVSDSKCNEDENENEDVRIHLVVDDYFP